MGPDLIANIMRQKDYLRPIIKAKSKGDDAKEGRMLIRGVSKHLALHSYYESLSKPALIDNIAALLLALDTVERQNQ